MYLHFLLLVSRVFKGLLSFSLYLTVILAEPSAAEEPLDELFFSHLNDEGVSVGTIEAILQDQYGYMWFGGSEGLVRFDGYNYTTFRNKLDDANSLSSNIVWDLLEDKQGQIWVATDVGLSLFHRDTETFTRYLQDDANPNSLPVNATRSIAEDAAGNLWIATTDGLAKLDQTRTQFTIFRHNENDSNSLSHDELRRVYVSGDGVTIWIGNYKSGLNILDSETGKITRFPFSVHDGTGLNYGSLNCIFEDRSGYIWLGTDGAGLNRYDPKTGKFSYFVAEENGPGKLRNNMVTQIIEDKFGHLWVATEGGLHYFNRDTQQFKYYSHNAYKRHSMQANNVHSILFDNNNDLWIGYFPSGVGFLDTSNMMFKTYRHDPGDINSLNNASVLSVKESPENVLWLGTDGGGLNSIDLNTGTFSHFPSDPGNPEGINSAAVLTVVPAGNDKFWLGTWHGGINLFDTKTQRARHFQFEPDNPDSLANDNVWSLILDEDQNLWAGTIGGGVGFLKKGSDKFETYQQAYEGDAGFYVVWKVFQTQNKEIWAGTNQGLGKLNREKNIFEFYRHDAKNPRSLSFDVVVDITEDGQNRLWIATRGGGLNLFDRETETFRNFREQDGLPSDVVKSVEADNIGNLWMGSDKGLTKYNPESGSFVTYTEHNGLQGNVFNFSSSLKLKSGDMVFGGTNGITIFNPAELKASNSIPPVDIVDFQIFNKPVPIAEEGSPLKQSIMLTDHITLNYKQTVFSFSFTALSFRNPQKNRFAYKMEGFERDWNYVGASRRNVTYTNLDAGNYVFKVKAANNEGVWNEIPRRISITILPPPWLTWWAYTLYALVAIGLLASVFYRQIRKRKQAEEQSRLLEMKVAERTAELRSKNKDIEAMLSNMRQGLFTIEEDGTIHGEYSKFLEEIFACSSIAGRDVFEFLFQHAQLSQDKLDQIKASIFSIIGEDSLNFSFNSHLLPAEYQVLIDDNLKHLALDWSPLDSDENELKIMVTVRDVTRLKKAQAEAMRQQRELSMVGQLIKLKGNKFYSFQQSIQLLLSSSFECLSQTSEFSDQDKALLFRNMHTIKGNSRTMGLSYISDIAHIAESQITEMGDSAEKHELKAVVGIVEQVKRVFEEYCEVFFQVLGREEKLTHLDDEGFLLNKDTIKLVQASLASLVRQYQDPTLQMELMRINAAIEEDLSEPLSTVLEDVVNSLPSIAKEIDKACPTVIFEESNIRLLPTATHLVQNVFTHLFRNALDHGIESADERKANGKPTKGTINVSVYAQSGQLTILLKDDGKGLDVQKLREKGVTLGVFQQDEAPAMQDIAQLIFKSGVSTKDSVSTISGRGVGMDAVKQFLNDQNGDIQISVAQQGGDSSFLPFEVVITLPNDLFVELQSAA
ncbi:Chemotaxis protein CheA [Thalassocella blandensis]|nr:Chemotaxis protein CheA [Thalassocella blandensis]